MSAPPAEVGRPWTLWTAQVLAVLRMEARKNFLGKRAIPIYLLAAAPVFVLSLRAFVIASGMVHEELGDAGLEYAMTFQAFILRFIVFFGCTWIFMNLFRGEILDRSLHYYFLSPIRRDVLVVAKFLSGLLASIVFFVATTAVTLVLQYLPYGASAVVDHVLGSGFGDTLAYLGVTALGCLGYGAVFLVAGLFFRNPMIPAVVILGWEWVNFLLPPALKKISVIYYLISLCPLQVSQGPIAMMAEPTSAWVAVPGLLALTVAVLLIARWKIRRTEISYGAE
jgi:ABC-type transport system involved in multi-copper enzyme maturation permease subunit